jgi:hypothetical protein
VLIYYIRVITHYVIIGVGPGLTRGPACAGFQTLNSPTERPITNYELAKLVQRGANNCQMMYTLIEPYT